MIASDIKHYDFGNKHFESFLDPLMQYSCGMWDGADNLSHSQIIKLDYIDMVLQLDCNSKILDLGCGWGGFSKHFKDYNIDNVTVSHEQSKYCNARLCDWKNLNRVYDKIVCVGMLEHVRRVDYNQFFKKVSECLVTNGMMYLQFISSRKPLKSWTLDTMFPGSELGSLSEVIKVIEENELSIVSIANDREDYVKTLNAWCSNYIKNNENPNKDWIKYFKTCRKGFGIGLTDLYRVVIKND